MSRLPRASRFLPLAAAGMAVCFLSVTPPSAEADPKGRGRSHQSQSIKKQNTKPKAYRQAAPQGRRGDRRDHGYRAPDRQRRGDRDHAYRDHDRQRRERDRSYRAPRNQRGEHRVYRAPRHHRRADYCPPSVVYRSAPVYRPVPYCPPPRPWYEGARRVYVGRDEFYFHAGLGVYLGGLALSIEVGNVPPPGYSYYDPYCGGTYASLDAYRGHCGHGGHDAAVSLVAYVN